MSHRQKQKKKDFRRKKGESPIEIQTDIKIKIEKKQSNYNNPDAWGKLIGRINTAPIFLEGHLVTRPFGYWFSIVND